ncbi:DUF805 domain-containing protein [Terrihabitans sp. B22-R8]|uniref:DUF805 domain-containing protein n=1 Tax=Terrihabitans sp. B22-R8 TaxID=3425128 RepID=UPI00403C5486
MDWQTQFLSFKGRMARGRYWVTTLLLTVLIVAIVLAASFVPWLMGTTVSDDTLLLVFVVLSLFAVYPLLAISVKRLHDRNKSGWWLAAMYVPPMLAEISLGESAESNFIGLVFGLWAFIELGFLRGTSGPNRFGPDPLAAEAPAL